MRELGVEPFWPSAVPGSSRCLGSGLCRTTGCAALSTQEPLKLSEVLVTGGGEELEHSGKLGGCPNSSWPYLFCCSSSSGEGPFWLAQVAGVGGAGGPGGAPPGGQGERAPSVSPAVLPTSLRNPGHDHSLTSFFLPEPRKGWLGHRGDGHLPLGPADQHLGRHQCPSPALLPGSPGAGRHLRNTD